MKVWIYRLKSEPKSIYAFTMDKSISKRFEFERNMELFIKEKISLTDMESRIFMKNNKMFLIQKEVLFDADNNNFELLASIDESSLVDAYCERIYDVMEVTRSHLHLYPIDESYLKIIDDITLNIIANNEKEPTSLLNVDTFKLFYFLHGKTLAIKWKGERKWMITLM